MTPTVVEVAYPAHRDAASWAARHAQGEVPSRWPYGLDALDDVPGTSARAIAVHPARRLDAALAAVLPLRARAALRGQPDTVALAWDENVVRDVVLRYPRRRVLCGVIWLTDQPDSPVRRRRVALLRELAGVWVLSAGQVPALEELLGPDGPPVHLVPFGIDADFFTPAPPPEEPLVLSLGVDRHRDHATLLRALGVVAAERPGTRVVVQGPEGLEAPAGVEVVQRMPHHELRDLYRRASVVVVATHENLHVSGMTVALEAAATARPMVLSRTPGVEGYVVDGVTGRTPAVGDVDGVAAAVDALLGDPALARTMGLAARAKVEAEHTTAAMAARLAAAAAAPAR